MIEGKGLGGKKVNRVNMSLSNRYDTKLKRLATSLNIRPTTLAERLIVFCLESPELVSILQKKYSVHDAYKVIPLENYITGELEFLLKERE
ncbi:hypothetical protein P9E34_19550 [Schinkia azotoformans]|uniref:hypothetical protein n=1 Tax=Schinkia azotoformans TaxID=1454 RepID=UPI002DB672BE|nr:hypothetical protein [Schinkia azotoformans]MEC1726909.1 hypothetical protein [Schinkia azotoformans]